MFPNAGGVTTVLGAEAVFSSAYGDGVVPPDTPGVGGVFLTSPSFFSFPNFFLFLNFVISDSPAGLPVLSQSNWCADASLGLPADGRFFFFFSPDTPRSITATRKNSRTPKTSHVLNGNCLCGGMKARNDKAEMVKGDGPGMVSEVLEFPLLSASLTCWDTGPRQTQNSLFHAQGPQS